MTSPKLSPFKKVTGFLNVNIFVDCPECEAQVDLMTDVDDANDEGQMWRVINSNSWKDLDIEVVCPHCKKEFTFDAMVY